MMQQKNRLLVSLLIFIGFGCLAAPEGKKIAEGDIPHDALVSLQQAVVSAPRVQGNLVPCLMQESLCERLKLNDLKKENASLLKKGAQWMHGLFHNDAQPITYTNQYDKPAVVVDQSASVGGFMPVLIDRQRLIDNFNLKSDFPVDSAVVLLKSGKNAVVSADDVLATFHAKKGYQYEQKLSLASGTVSLPIYRALVSDVSRDVAIGVQIDAPQKITIGVQIDQSSILQEDESGEESEEEEIEEPSSPERYCSLVEQGKLKLFQEQKPWWKRLRSTILSVGLPVYAAAVSVYAYGLQNDLSAAQSGQLAAHNDAMMAYGNVTAANAQHDQMCNAFYQDCINGNSPVLGIDYQELLNAGVREGACRIFNQFCL